MIDVKLQEIASNPDTKPDVLVDLSKSEDKYIRSAVARNVNCPIDVMSELSRDMEEIVVEGLAGNTSTPVELLETIFENCGHYTYQVLGGNPRLPVALLIELVGVDEDDGELNFPDEIRQSVAGNPSTPKEILEILINDDDINVRSWAQSNLESRH
jgi:hypothetical protein